MLDPFLQMLLYHQTYHKATDTWLLLHYHNFINHAYKRFLIAMLQWTYNFNSDWVTFLKDVD